VELTDAPRPAVGDTPARPPSTQAQVSPLVMVQLPSPARTACKLVLPDTTVAALLVLSVTCQPNLGMRGCKPSSANNRAAATGDDVPIGPAAPLLVKEDTPKFSRVGHTGGVIAGVDDFDAELVVVHPPRITVATASPTQVPTRTVLHAYILASHPPGVRGEG
jgi:hypothetical protein